MSTPGILRQSQQKVWEGCVPLEIKLASSECKTYDESEPYLLSCPRISYLPLILPKLHAFFKELLINEEASATSGWFSYESVPLKWQFPIGLLYDIYSGANDHLQQDDNGQSSKKPTESNSPVDAPTAPRRRTWQLTVHFDDYPSEVLARLDEDGKVMRDAFTNSYKEASFVRYSSTKVVQRLSMEDAMQLWQAVEKHDFGLFLPVNQKMIRPRDVEIKNIPVKIYIPAAASDDDDTSTAPGHLRVIQGLISPQVSARQPQTLGTALNKLAPSLFPSRRMPILAHPVLHGAIVPLSISLDTLSEVGAYADGYLHMTVTMIR